MILIWGICVFEIGRATIISSQTKRITRVILAFLASLLTISINPIGMILLDFINWRHINSFADYFSKAYWIIFLIHMLLFWLGEEIGYFHRKDFFNMVKIISDSTCDLSAELVAQYDIDILPLHILLGDEEFEDGKTITPDEIYSWSDEHKTTPKLPPRLWQKRLNFFALMWKKDARLSAFPSQTVCQHPAMSCVLLPGN